MTSETVLIHPINDDNWFDAFNFTPGQDDNIRWLSRPNQEFLQEICSRDAEKFRITFDVEHFQPQQIKIYIMNCQLTISGVYEERSEGRYMQKQFEKSFDVPDNADVQAMAAYITPAHMLVVEIPLNLNQHPRQATKVDSLSVNNTAANQRRLSFSLDKFNKLNNQSLVSPPSSPSSLSAPSASQQVRRTSITKTMTTTTTTTAAPGSTGLSPAAAALLDSGDASQTNTHTFKSERRASNTGSHQIIINEPASPPSPPSHTILSNSDLANLGIEIPPELLAVGGTITIQKRRVSVTRTADAHANHPTSSTIIKTTSNILEQPQTLSTTSNPSLSQPTINERRGSTTILTNNERKMFTLEEFLQNKTWNPSVADGFDGKKILCMRLEMKPGTTADHLRITLNGYDLRVEVNDKLLADASGQTHEQSYRQVTLFPTCDVNQLKTVLKSDGFLHIQLPIQL